MFHKRLAHFDGNYSPPILSYFTPRVTCLDAQMSPIQYLGGAFFLRHKNASQMIIPQHATGTGFLRPKIVYKCICVEASNYMFIKTVLLLLFTKMYQYFKCTWSFSIQASFNTGAEKAVLQ